MGSYAAGPSSPVAAELQTVQGVLPPPRARIPATDERPRGAPPASTPTPTHHSALTCCACNQDRGGPSSDVSSLLAKLQQEQDAHVRASPARAWSRPPTPA